MKSPFPGMDPYIEANELWGDFHVSLISSIKVALARQAPPGYAVRGQLRSYLVLVEPDEKAAHRFYPDVSITTKEKVKRGGKKHGAVALADSPEQVQPVSLRALVTDTYRESFVEIYETKPEQRLVTAIEVLSPSNKRPKSEGREVYLRKRQAALLDQVNLIEIDLLRGGERMPMFDPWPDFLYTLLVARAHNFQRCEVWPAHCRTPLPVIPVPLAEPHADLTLDLQPLLDDIYEVSRYADTIDYTRPLSPALASEDATWLKRRLREWQAH